MDVHRVIGYNQSVWDYPGLGQDRSEIGGKLVGCTCEMIKKRVLTSSMLGPGGGPGKNRELGLIGAWDKACQK